MASVTSCPNTDTVEFFLQGGLDDARCRAIKEHLELCPACLTLVERLAGAEPLAKALAGQAQAVSPSLFGDVDFAALTERLKALRPGAKQAGALIGPYRLLERIGEGGMGTVWKAEQTAPVRRTVAIKLIKAGMGTRQVLARFEAERQALALMDHPNIAKVLDAGTTDSGQPYFVMELVNGMPITKYCDEHRMTPRERLELLVPVCQAIQHAHQKGVIHRDIKPNNVLVATYDGKAVPKVIDFGVAKATSEKLTEQTLSTSFGRIVGTLEYMGPEQAEFNALEIDTRSDIYALGAVLYELLTGTTPFSRDRLRRTPVVEALRIIREEEPARPSARLSQSKETLPAVAARRSTEPAKLAKLVRGDLDWLVMKALEKDRNRRYDSANGLALDIERYLHDEPVLASPPRTVYRLRKFARRNKGPLVAAAVVFLALVGGLVGTSLALGEAQTQRDTAKANELEANRQKAKAQASEAEARVVLKFFEDKVLAAARPKGSVGALESAAGLGTDATILGAMNAAEPQIAEVFRDNPLAEASIRDVMAWVYRFSTATSELAVKQCDRQLQLHMAALGPDHPDTLNSMDKLAQAYQFDKRFKDAVLLFQETRKRKEALFGKYHPDTLHTMDNLGQAYRAGKRLKDAVLLFEETLKGKEALFGKYHPDTLFTMGHLANAYQEAGQLSEAFSLYEETVKVAKATLGDDHPDTLTYINNLANAYQRAGRFNEALARREEVLKLREKAFKQTKAKLGPDHPDTLQIMDDLSRAYRAGKWFDDALPLLEEAFKQTKAKLGPDHPDTLTRMMNLASGYQSAGRLDVAVRLYEDILTRRKAKPGQDQPGTLVTMQVLAMAYEDAGRLAEAEPLWRALAAHNEQKAGADSPQYAGCLQALGRNLEKQLKYADAETMLRLSVAIREKKQPEAWTTFNSMSHLGASLVGQNKYAEAEPLLLKGYDGMKKRAALIPQQMQIRLTEALERIVALYEATEQDFSAEQWRKELEAAKREEMKAKKAKGSE